MNDRPFDRIADAFLAPGPVVLPDRVLDAAFEEVHLTRQRRPLWRAPWRFSIMNTYAKVAVAAVAVIAVGLLGLTFLGPEGGGPGGAPSAAPSATPAVTSPTPSAAPTAAPLTGQFTSDLYGISMAYPEGWVVAPATEPCVTAGVNYIEPGADIIHHPQQEANLFMRLCSQALGDRTADEWSAEMLATDECGDAVEPITIAGQPGSITVPGCDHAQVVADGRGYVIRLYTSGDEPWIASVHDRGWFESVLATVELHPEDAVDDAASTTPALTGQFTSPSHGYAVSYPEGWNTRPATAPWTANIVDYFNAGSDLLMPGDPGSPFLALASQPLGDRTREQFEADYWQIMVDDDPGTSVCAGQAEPITIDGAPGVTACDVALVTDGGRGYVVMLWSSDGPPYDEAWFASVLATMELHPEDAVDAP